MSTEWSKRKTPIDSEEKKKNTFYTYGLREVIGKDTFYEVSDLNVALLKNCALLSQLASYLDGDSFLKNWIIPGK